MEFTLRIWKCIPSCQSTTAIRNQAIKLTELQKKLSLATHPSFHSNQHWLISCVPKMQGLDIFAKSPPPLISVSWEPTIYKIICCVHASRVSGNWLRKFRIQRKWYLGPERETSAHGDAELGQCKKDQEKSRNDRDPFIHPCVKNFNRNAAHVILRTSQILQLLLVFELPRTISPWESEVAESPEIMEACHLTLSLQPHLCQTPVYFFLLFLLFFSPLPQLFCLRFTGTTHFSSWSHALCISSLKCCCRDTCFFGVPAPCNTYCNPHCITGPIGWERNLGIPSCPTIIDGRHAAPCRLPLFMSAEL